MKNFLTTVFLIIFCTTLCEIAGLKPAISQSHFTRVKSHLVFKKEFSGIVKVIDGDSIKVSNNEVRLFGIDAPEYKQNCLDAKGREYHCGTNSYHFLQDLAEGKKVTCRYAQKDKYDRYLSKCDVGEVSINQELIRSGMAVIYNFTESDEVMDGLEEQAREQKLGVWQGPFQLPKEYRKTHPRDI